MSLCVVVGVGPKIGSGVARAFAKEGYDVAMVARDESHLEPYGREVNSLGQKAYTVGFDATDPEATQKGFGSIMAQAGTPDVVVYTPAVMPMFSYSELTPQIVEDTFQVMVYGAMNTVQAVLPAMREAGRGTLLFVGGGFGVDPSIKRAPHSIGKAALRHYAHGLHLELASEGIHAGTVTVYRPVDDGEDMAACAGQFVKMHKEPKESWSWEMEYGRS